MMLRTRFAFPAVIVMLLGLLLAASNTGLSPTVSAAPNQQTTLDIPHQMVPSNWAWIPSGLGPGDSFRLMFVTEGYIDGTTNGISRYNSFVREAAKASSMFKDHEHLYLSFTALVSVYQGLDARGNTRTRVGDPGEHSPIYWAGNAGKKVADNYADFYDGSWDSREARKSDGGWYLIEFQRVLTGSTHQGTHAIHGNGWNLGLGSPPAWWNGGLRTTAVGSIGTIDHDTPGKEIYVNGEANASDTYPIYGISPLLKVRSTTGVKPVISGPTGTVRGPFDVSITFPDDDQINGMALGAITVVGGTASNLRHTAGAGTAAGAENGTAYTVTITPDYDESIYDSTTVIVSMNDGAVSDVNGWKSVASDALNVKSTYLEKTAVTISFDENGVGTVPKSWAYIPSADLKPGDSFRLLFVTSDTRNAQSKNIDDYNSFVQNAAGRSELLRNFSGRFRALASTYGTHAIDNSGTRGTGVPIYWLEGARVANSYTDFYDGSWASKAGTDEAGRRLGHSTDIWTGTNSDGTRNGQGLGSTFFYSTYDSLGVRSPFGISGTSTDYKNHFYSLSPVLKIAEPGGL